MSSFTITQGYKFGTFKGVFTPSILTILGVIMYLRFGWVLANVGTTWTLVIVTVSTMVTFLTALSMSALATNMKIGGGGAYYIISRSLGLEAGAAIGLPLFFAQALGISFYITGFAESVAMALKDFAPYAFGFIEVNLGPPETIIGVCALVVLAVLTYISADLTLKTQFFILGIIVLSLVVFFMGSGEFLGVSGEAVESAPNGNGLVLFPDNFWVVFAVFFPAVTGIEAGIAMSGDLKNPSRSLPRGTLAAIGVSYMVYMAIPLFLGYVIPLGLESGREVLLTDSLVMCKVAGKRLGVIVLMAVWGASLSSAVGSMLGAPRTMQALARDSILPRFLGKGYGKGNDPRVATVLTFTFALCGIILGNINFISPILTMFFLTSYGLLNICAGVEGLLGRPSWRPTFKMYWPVSFLGAGLCLAIMLQINAAATLVAALITATVYYLVKRRSLSAHWGDARYGILMLSARNAVFKMSRSSIDEKNWLPNILLLSGAPSSRWHLVQLGNSIAGRHGFLTIAAIVSKKQTPVKRVASIEEAMYGYLDKHGIMALVKVVREDSSLDGAMELVRTYGFGPLVPNTIIVGITEKKESFVKFAQLVRLIHESKRNTIIVREADVSEDKDGDGDEKEKVIDIWWGGRTNNGSLMVAMAYMLLKSDEWVGSRIRLKTIITEEPERESVRMKLDNYIFESRIGMTGEIIMHSGGDVFRTMQESSADADLVFLGIRPPQEKETVEDYGVYYENLLAKTKGFPFLVKTLASEDIEFRRIFTE